MKSASVHGYGLELTGTEEQKLELEILYGLAHDLARSSDIEAMADHLFARAKRLLEADTGFLMQTDAGYRVLRGVAASGVDAEIFRQERIELDAELAPVSRAFQTRQPVVIADVTRSPFLSERLRKKYDFLKSAWIVPLMNGQEAEGILVVGYTTQREASPKALRLLQLLGDEAALAIARARMTEALRESEEKYRVLVENLHDGVFIVQDDNMQFVNAAFARMLGYTVEDILGLNFREFLTPEDLEMVSERYRRRQAGEAVPQEYECSLLHKDKTTRVIVEMNVTRAQYQGRLASIGTVKDITARKRAEQALRESEERLKTIFETVNDVIAMLSPEGIITEVNRATEVLLGYTREELMGKSFDLFLTSASAALAHERLERALMGESLPSLFEMDVLRKDGVIVPLETKGRFLHEGEKFVGHVCIARDGTVRKELERQRADFMTMLTYDIKNPLGVILGYTELLLEAGKKHGSRDEEGMLKKIQSNAHAVHALVANYLKFSRIETGHRSLTKRLLRLSEILTRVRQEHEAEARRRHLSLDLQLKPELPLVEGDPLALERVFANLVDNALKFTPKLGRVTMSIGQQNEWAVVSVANTGVGIASEEVSALFDRYQQGTIDRSQEETELGISVVMTLVEAHGGKLKVENSVEKGCCFSVYLPIASAGQAGR